MPKIIYGYPRRPEFPTLDGSPKALLSARKAWIETWDALQYSSRPYHGMLPLVRGLLLDEAQRQGRRDLVAGLEAFAVELEENARRVAAGLRAGDEERMLAASMKSHDRLRPLVDPWLTDAALWRDHRPDPPEEPAEPKGIRLAPAPPGAGPVRRQGEGSKHRRRKRWGPKGAKGPKGPGR
jgi:hypothetical protein